LDAEISIDISSGYVYTLIGGSLSSGMVNGVGTNAQLGGIHSLALSSSGVLYVADTTNKVIRVIDPTGTIPIQMDLVADS
jgi:hypothetical protein